MNSLYYRQSQPLPLLPHLYPIQFCVLLVPQPGVPGHSCRALDLMLLLPAFLLPPNVWAFTSRSGSRGNFTGQIPVNARGRGGPGWATVLSMQVRGFVVGGVCSPGNFTFCLPSCLSFLFLSPNSKWLPACRTREHTGRVLYGPDCELCCSPIILLLTSHSYLLTTFDPIRASFRSLSLLSLYVIIIVCSCKGPCWFSKSWECVLAVGPIRCLHRGSPFFDPI